MRQILKLLEDSIDALEYIYVLNHSNTTGVTAYIALTDLRTQYELEKTLDGIGLRDWPKDTRFNTRFYDTELDRGSGPFPVLVEYSLEERGQMVCIWESFVDTNDGFLGDEHRMRLTDAEDQRISEEISARPETWEIDYD